MSEAGRLAGRLIGLGVTGSIAAYKAVELLRLLRAEGADVAVMLTPSATRFVGPLSFAALSRHPVETDAARPAPRRPDRPHRGRRHGRRDRRRAGDRPLAGRDGQRPGRRRRDRDVPRDVGAGRRRAGDGRRHVDATRRRSPTSRGCASSATRSSSPTPGRSRRASRASGAWPSCRRSSTPSWRPSPIARSVPPDPAARPPLVGAGPRRRPGRPPHRGDRGRHARGDRPGPLHRQPLDRARWASAIAEAALDRGARVTLIAANVEVALPAGATVVRGRVDRRPARRAAARDPRRRRRGRVRCPGHGRRRRRLPAGRRRPTRKLARGDGLTLELEPTPDLLAEIGRIARGLDCDGAPTREPLRPRSRSWSGSPPRPARSSARPRSSGARASTCSSPTTSRSRAPGSGPTPTGSRSWPPTARARTCRCCPSARSPTGCSTGSPARWTSATPPRRLVPRPSPTREPA